MNKRVKLFLCSILYGLFIFKGSCKKDYYVFNDFDDKSFDYYNGINIYFVNSIDEVLNDGNVYVIDFRDEIDPDFIINNSYKINDLKTMRWVLNCLKVYEDGNPSLWNRSMSSMEYEWFVHNLGYELGLFRDNCKNVDLNNYDEGNIIPGLYKYIK